MHSLLLELDRPNGKILERLKDLGGKVDLEFEPITVQSEDGGEHTVICCEFERLPILEQIEAIPGVTSVFSNPKIAPMNLVK